jgi:hypothetical protein
MPISICTAPQRHWPVAHAVLSAFVAFAKLDLIGGDLAAKFLQPTDRGNPQPRAELILWLKSRPGAFL